MGSTSPPNKNPCTPQLPGKNAAASLHSPRKTKCPFLPSYSRTPPCPCLRPIPHACKFGPQHTVIRDGRDSGYNPSRLRCPRCPSPPGGTCATRQRIRRASRHHTHLPGHPHHTFHLTVTDQTATGSGNVTSTAAGPVTPAYPDFPEVKRTETAGGCRTLFSGNTCMSTASGRRAGAATARVMCGSGYHIFPARPVFSCSPSSRYRARPDNSVRLLKRCLQARDQ